MSDTAQSQLERFINGARECMDKYRAEYIQQWLALNRSDRVFDGGKFGVIVIDVPISADDEKLLKDFGYTEAKRCPLLPTN